MTTVLDKAAIANVAQTSVLPLFGPWIHHNHKDLCHRFLTAQPFEHIVIEPFLAPAFAEQISEQFPTPTSTEKNTWHEYKNPIEVKYAFDDIDRLPPALKHYFYALSTPEFIARICAITGMPDLEYDEYLHGAGVHLHPRHGRLNIHLDYEKHPLSGKERRLNIILFMSKGWDAAAWKGANELWDKDVTQCVTKTDVQFNRAILFKTNDISWHGVPDKIQCPEHVFRQSLAYYYVSPLVTTHKTEEQYRKKARFVKRPQDPYDEKMQQLYDIRPNRRITQDDLDRLMPEWTVET